MSQSEDNHIVDFELSADLQELRARARAFAEEELAPHAGDWDRKAEFPAEAIKKAAQLGFLRLTIPERHGGLGRGSLASCVMLEEINAACPSTGVTISVHNSLFCAMLAKWGTEAQMQRCFQKLASGEWLGAYCLSEAGAGSDAAALQCEAKKDGDHYVLDGPKLWITSGSEAGIYVVFARTSEDRTRGISAFLVERELAGVGIGRKETKLGIKASPTVEVLLDSVRVPAENRIDEEGQGFPIALDTLDGGRLGIAAQSLGIARASLGLIKAHLAKQVDAKGRSRSSQSSQWAMADIAADLDAARFLTWRAALLRDQKKPCGREAAMAKLMTSRLANRAARAAVTIIGPAAGSGASAAERFLRDARITEIYEGVTDIQRLVVARAELAT